ncbi:MAG: prepilin-type N-terminal cleavage/methylation domain-containing protein [Myxococcales bacterium]|nr:prepilin-type N-terminal cleavage/methylation domain-containing protein [Myxococcales bacterium]
MRARGSRRAGEQGGFTIMELLVSMLLMSIVIVGLTGLQLQAIRQATRTRRANEATQLASSRAEHYRTVGYDTIVSTIGAWPVAKNHLGTEMRNVGVDGVSKGPYTVQELIEVLTNRKIITVRVTWLSADSQRRLLSATMTTHRAP